MEETIQQLALSPAQQCPWSQYPTGHFPQCEAKLCEWIRQPSNAYSNIGFLIVGILLLALFLKKKSRHGFDFGIATIIVGLCSFGAHSTGILTFTFLDFAGIFFTFAVFAATNTIYDEKIKLKNTLLVALIYFIPPTLLMYFVTGTREIIFATFVIGLLYWESLILKKQGKGFLVKSMKKVLFVFGLAVICLFLDATKIICNPDNHIVQMHALWHIFNAISIFYLAKHLDEHHI